MLDFYAYLTSVPNLWPVIVVFGFVGAAVTAYLMWYLITILKAVNSIITSAYGNPEKHHELLQNIKEQNTETQARIEKVENLLEGHIPLCNEHFADIDKMYDQDTWKRCPIENCIAFQRIANTYGDLKSRLELFEVEAVNARNRTAENLKDMSVGITKTSNELSALATEIIGIFREGRWGK